MRRFLALRRMTIGLLGLATASMAQSPQPPAGLGHILQHLPDLWPDDGTGAQSPATTPPARPDTRSDRPLLVPTRDVAVTWTVQLPGRAATEMTEHYSVAQSRKRDNFPGGNYWITDIAQDRVLIVLPATNRSYASSGALRLSTVLPKETSFRRGLSESIAGVSCTNWHIAAPDGYRLEACITEDGVPLRLADDSRRNVATKIDYGPQDASLFTVPPDLRPIDLPPLGPTHDATIRYRGERVSNERLKEDVFARNMTVYIVPSRRMARFEGQAPDYVIADDVAHRVTYVAPGQKAYRTEVLTGGDRPAVLYIYGWPFKMLATAKFIRGDDATIAGLSCTNWHVLHDADAPWFDACISHDGLILRLAGTRDKEAGAIEAVTVDYGSPAGSLFTVPTDFREAK